MLLFLLGTRVPLTLRKCQAAGKGLLPGHTAQPNLTQKRPSSNQADGCLFIEWSRFSCERAGSFPSWRTPVPIACDVRFGKRNLFCFSSNRPWDAWKTGLKKFAGICRPIVISFL